MSDVPPEEAKRRHARLNALTPLQQDELCHVLGEAALDLWARGESWPDLIERCLEAVEEEPSPEERPSRTWPGGEPIRVHAHPAPVRMDAVDEAIPVGVHAPGLVEAASEPPGDEGPGFHDPMR